MDPVKVYLNNAATTWPKPKEVVDAVVNSFNTPTLDSTRYCNCSKRPSDIDNVCRTKISEMFHVENNKFKVILTTGCTESLNIFTNQMARNGLTTLVCGPESHNSITRCHFEKIKDPIMLMIRNSMYDMTNIEALKEEIIRRKLTDKFYVAITQCCNVDGTLTPDENIQKVVDTFREFNPPVVVDITQSAGTFEFNLSKYNYDNMYVACSCHKGLYSVQGIGFLIAPTNGLTMPPLISGGTGKSFSERSTDNHEAGTGNELAMTSLSASIDYIKKTGLENIQSHKEMLVNYMVDKINNLPNKDKFDKVFYMFTPKTPKGGIICLKNVNQTFSRHVVTTLLNSYRIVLRNGLHCAPLYSRNYLKCDTTVRISFGMFNTTSDIDYVIESLVKALDASVTEEAEKHQEEQKRDLKAYLEKRHEERLKKAEETKG